MCDNKKVFGYVKRMTLIEILLSLIFIALMTIILVLYNILFDIRYWEYRKRREKEPDGIDETGVSYKTIVTNCNSFKLLSLNFFIQFLMMSAVSVAIIFILKWIF